MARRHPLRLHFERRDSRSSFDTLQRANLTSSIPGTGSQRCVRVQPLFDSVSQHLIGAELSQRIEEIACTALALLLPTVCAAQSNSAIETVKVKFEASEEADTHLLVEKLNEHGCGDGLVFEPAGSRICLSHLTCER
jgi:hypothetical protein